MASHLESVPRDILHHIAFLLASSSVLEPPHDLIHLLLVSSTIHRSLRVSNCPHLYANIFRTKFDLLADIHNHLTDSALAVELLRRCHVLRRARHRDLSFENSRQDLFAALRMVLESGGVNEAQLFAAGFPEFILSFVRKHLSHDTDYLTSGHIKHDTNALAVWLLCFTLSAKVIAEISTETKEEIIRLLRPSAASPGLARNTAINVPAWSSLQHSTGGNVDVRSSHRGGCVDIIAWSDGEQGLTYNYFEPQIPIFPEPTSAAIIVTFALKESFIFGIPTHLPENRAAALAAQRSGPTMEDFRTITSYKTPLLVDIRDAEVSQRMRSSTTVETVDQKRHDHEFCRLLQSNYHLSSSLIFPYTPGTLTGLWEGCFMISCLVEPKIVSPVSPFSEDYSCRKPMQCAISEYMCFSPHLPLPFDDPSDLNFGPVNLLESEDGFEIRSRKFGYEKYSPPSNTNASVQRDPGQALDVVIMGETLDDHEQAWGGFRFMGRIRPDGLISIRREPKSAGDAHLGTWIFEGRLRYGVALVGQLRSSMPTEDCDTIRGIFSLHKVSETW